MKARPVTAPPFPLTPKRIGAFSFAVVLSIAAVAHGQVNTKGASARDLTINYQRAVGLLESGEPRRGLALLHEVLSALDETDDVLIPLKGGTDGSLKTACMDRLRSAAEDELDFYEKQFGPEAEVQLEAARQAGELERMELMENVSRKFFYTKAGTRATRELALRKMDRGDALGAAMTLTRLRQFARDPKRFEPSLSATLAAAWMRAGIPMQARRVLAELRNSGVESITTPAGNFAIDESGKWPDWLGAGDENVDRRKDWPLFLGNMQRNRESEPVVPKWTPLWTTNTLQTVVIESDLDREAVENGFRRMTSEIREMARRRRELSIVPAPVPLVVGDRVVFRSPLTISAIRARDSDGLQSGELAWETYKPDPQIMTAFRQAIQRSGVVPVRNGAATGEAAFLYSWKDLTSGTLASDGRFVFAVEETDRSQFLDADRGLRRIVQGRKPNYLRAYGLASGSVAWQIGGERGIRVAGMRDALFLGPPLPFGDDLLLIVASRDELRLLQIHVVDPLARQPTIRLVWSQQIGRINGQNGLSFAARLGGLSPAYSGGVLVCPTGSGEIVAVDPGARALMWRHAFRSDASQSPPGWVDSLPRIADESVVVPSTGSDSVHCIDLRTGELRWAARHPRGRYVATTQDIVVCIGSGGANAFRLKDGTPAWEKPIEFGQPTGRGLLHGNSMSVPLRGGRVLTFDVSTGKVLCRVQSGVDLGNLVAAGDLIVSQSATQLTAFPGLKSVSRTIDEALLADANDSDMRLARAVLRFQNDQMDLGLEDLKVAARGGFNPRATDLLVDMVTSLDGEALRNHIELLNELDTASDRGRPVDDLGRPGPVEVIHYATSDLGRSARLKLQLARIRSNSPLTQESASMLAGELFEIAKHLNVDRFVFRESGLISEHRFLASAVRDAIDRAPESDGIALTQAIAAEVTRGIAEGNIAFARTVFDWLTNPNFEVKRTLALALRRDDPAAAVALLSEIRNSTDLKVRLQATEALVELLHERRPDYVRELIRELRADAKIHRPTADVLAKWEDDPTFSPFMSRQPAWPMGQPEVQPNEDFDYAFSTQIVAQERQTTGWVYHREDERIVGRDSRHREQLVLDVGPLTPEEQQFNRRLPYAVETPTTLVLPRHAKRFEVYDLLAPGDRPSMLWESRVRRTSPYDPFYQSAVRQIGPVGGSTLLVTQGDVLVASDLRTGNTLWSREIRLRDRSIYADSEKIALVDRGESVELFSLFDGRPLGAGETPSGAHVVCELGRGQVVEATGQLGGREVASLARIAFGDPEPVWERRFGKGSVVSNPMGGFCAVAIPAGSIHIVRLSDGQSVASVETDPIEDLRRAVLHLTPDQFVVFTDKSRQWDRFGSAFRAASRGRRSTVATIRGMGLALDRNTGEVLWNQDFPNESILLDKQREAILAPNLPVLVLFEAQLRASTFRVLDCRTGKTLYQSKEKLPQSFGLAKVRRDERYINILVGNGENIRIEFPDDEAQE